METRKGPAGRQGFRREGEMIRRSPGEFLHSETIQSAIFMAILGILHLP